jgi:hypothetical protein
MTSLGSYELFDLPLHASVQREVLCPALDTTQDLTINCHRQMRKLYDVSGYAVLSWTGPGAPLQRPEPQ